jgi:hypothetical protein
MRRPMTTILLLLTVVAPAFAQQKDASPEVPLDDRAWQILVQALEEAKTASPPVRAQVEFEFAKQLDQDNKKSEEAALLTDAYLTTLPLASGSYKTIGWIQSDILRTMMKNLGPEPVEKLLPQMDEAMRGLAFDLLVTRYTTDQNWDRALDAVRRAPKDNWFPFGPALALMKAEPSQNISARREIFAITYSIYEAGDTPTAALEPMIEQFWRELPRNQLIELIPIILKEAIRGQIYFIKRPNDSYDRAKAALLPILRELDPAKADQWDRDEQKTFEEVRKAGPFGANPKRTQQTASNPPKSPVTPVPYKKPPGSEKPRAVAGCLENEPWCQENRVAHALQVAMEHLKKHETELAKTSIDRGYWIARSQLSLDTDPVDPNQVIKTHWPSTVNWEAFSVMASRISPEYAMEHVKQIPDPEIRLLTRTLLARAWLDHRPVFPCPSLHSNYHDEGSCIPYQAYMPRELFSWANNWD